MPPAGKTVIRNFLRTGMILDDSVIALDLPLDVSGNFACYIFGGFKSIVFGDRFSVTGSGGSSASLSFFGGISAGKVGSIEECTTELPHSITVNKVCFCALAAARSICRFIFRVGTAL